jgi:hypothetical protein
MKNIISTGVVIKISAFLDILLLREDAAGASLFGNVDLDVNKILRGWCEGAATAVNS